MISVLTLSWWLVSIAVKVMRSAQLAESHCFGRNARMSGEAVESSIGQCILDLGGLEPNATAIYEEDLYSILPLRLSSHFLFQEHLKSSNHNPRLPCELRRTERTRFLNLEWLDWRFRATYDATTATSQLYWAPHEHGTLQLSRAAPGDEHGRALGSKIGSDRWRSVVITSDK